MSTAQGEFILVLDFGSQYTQLISRRIRELHVYSEIQPFSLPYEEVERRRPKGIILSGGPGSVHEPNGPRCDPRLLSGEFPLLGICYGMQLLAQVSGGRVEPGETREYGHAEVELDSGCRLFRGFEALQRVWMSHGDQVATLPPGFETVGRSSDGVVAAIADPEHSRYGIQFHPEVSHTVEGSKILECFARDICGCTGKWTMASFLGQAVAEMQARVGQDRVLAGLSGGIDSTVASLLLVRALGAGAHLVFVDNGLLRQGDADWVRVQNQERFQVPIHFIDARKRFLDCLEGVVDPEEKRKRIGAEFIRVFEEEGGSQGGFRFLLQGTLYPDVIESVSQQGPSATIKSHHNVGGLPPDLRFELIEPLRYLFKDEVRALGLELGLPAEVLRRQPFPGPGLAVRILGEVTAERLELVRRADRIVTEEVRRAGLYDSIWQAFAVLLPIKSVGVMGDFRTYENVLAVRAVHSSDGMTADWVRLPDPVLSRISSRIVNEVRGINRVVYDITSKPPSTIEWE
jgi:GMP synthase (glutamine-hydrolysing)